MGISNTFPTTATSNNKNDNHAKIIGFWQVDRLGYTLFIDPSLLKYLQIEDESELSQKPFYTFFSEESQAIIEEHSQLRAQGQSSTYEAELLGVNGACHHVLIYGSPNLDEQGQLIGRTAFLVDITKQKKLEKDFQEQNEQLKERVKELRCIYKINEVLHNHHITLEEIMTRVLYCIPPGMRYPEKAYAHIHIDSKSYKTTNYKNTQIKLSSPIIINHCNRGYIEVGYVDDNLHNNQELFLNEEKELIRSIAQRLDSAIARFENDQQLKHRISIEETIAEISKMLMTDEVPDYHQILELAGTTVSADRATLFQFNESLSSTYNIVEWCKNDNIEHFYSSQQLDSLNANPWFDILKKGENIVLNSVAKLTDITKNEHDILILRKSKTKSYVAIPIHYKSGALLGFIGMGMIEKEIKWSEEDVRLLRVIAEVIGNYWGRKEMEMQRMRFERMLESSSDIVAIFDINHKLQYINQSGQILFNIDSPNENKTFFNLHFDCAPYSLNCILRIAKKQGSWSGECTLKNAKHKNTPFSFLLMAPKNSNGEVQFYSLIGRDLTMLRHAEKERDRLFECSNDLICIANFQGIIKQVNPACYHSLGWKKNELLTSQWLSYIHPEDQHKLFKLYKALKQGKNFTNIDIRVQCKDRSYKWISWNFISLQENQTVFCVGRDIHELKVYEEEHLKLQEQLLHSQKMQSIGRLAGGVAHDFNNLLTVISGYTDISLRKAGPDSPLKDNLAEILKASERASSLTSQLLAFSRKQVLKPKVINLNHLLLDMDKMLRRLIGEDIELITSISETIGMVLADKSQIEQMIINLVINSRDAMPKGGKLILETKQVEFKEKKSTRHNDILPGKYIQIQVQDEGHGMTEETLNQIFEPFFTTKEVGRGTGLGLSTVYGIISQSNGYIDVQSTINVGTTFKIYLPIHNATELPTQQKQGRYPEYHGTETILVCEDEDIVRNMVSRILTDHGYKVQQTSHAKDALQQLSEYSDSIQLLITDIIMPGISGTELAKQVIKQYPKLKIMFMSGYTDDSLMQLNITDLKRIPFLQKPFSMSELLLLVRNELNKEEKI